MLRRIETFERTDIKAKIVERTEVQGGKRKGG